MKIDLTQMQTKMHPHLGIRTFIIYLYSHCDLQNTKWKMSISIKWNEMDDNKQNEIVFKIKINKLKKEIEE